MATGTRPIARGTWRDRFLNRVELLGNALPDPVAIFAGIILILMMVSAIGAAQGWTVTNPVTGEVLKARNLLSEDMIRQLLTEVPKTYTGFTPLGFALTIMLGAGVAEHSGLLPALLRRMMQGVPPVLLVPATILLGMLTIHAFDFGFLVYVPLAGMMFAAAGRNPVLGCILGFTGCCTGLAGNLLPGQYDVLIFGITQTGARLLSPQWEMNPFGNWWYLIAIAVAFIGLGWLLAEKVVGPRLGDWHGHSNGSYESPAPLSKTELRGLRRAGAVTVLFVGIVLALIFVPGYAPLYDSAAEPAQRILPFYRATVPLLTGLMVGAGWIYGKAVGTITTHRDVVVMMGKGLEGMLPYLVLAFFAAHFVAMFGWSNLAPIVAIQGAGTLRELHAPPALLLPLLATASAWLDFLIASGSAKWTAMAPVVVPMFMLLGVSPEMTTAAYRVGDVVTNLISPLNAYFILTLIYCQRWNPAFRLGSLLSATLPIAIAFYLAGLVITAGWVALDLPVGPGAAVSYQVPGQVLPAPAQ
ncbi:AbgT family transporter [Novosphingobium sp.]|uniref:AbgT family transporter n=1 Tax=Novosphingobium sp. TaxID=1874826 RepID=UPI00286CC75E|nr:AbgT family transporter [Novosphingobium sp.]